MCKSTSGCSQASANRIDRFILVGPFLPPPKGGGRNGPSPFRFCLLVAESSTITQVPASCAPNARESERQRPYGRGDSRCLWRVDGLGCPTRYSQPASRCEPGRD